jgi:hypothetical protein
MIHLLNKNVTEMAECDPLENFDSSFFSKFRVEERGAGRGGIALATWEDTLSSRGNDGQQTNREQKAER